MSRHLVIFSMENITSVAHRVRLDLDQKHTATGAASGIRQCHGLAGNTYTTVPTALLLQAVAG